MPRHPPNALTSRLKTRTTNDNTVSFNTRLPSIARLSNDFFCFHRIGAYGEKYYPRFPMPISTVIVQKNPFTMSKTDDRPNAEGQVSPAQQPEKLGCDGKLVAYILEDMVCVESTGEMVEPIGIEPMT
jgi:hypothetical protein